METDVKEMLRKLAAPFPESAVKWRSALCGLNAKGEPFALVVPYIDARALQDRLDQTVGSDGWKVEYRQGIRESTICKLSLRINGEWISKEDGSDVTEIEPIKGSLSAAFRRAAVTFGMARYLYRLNQMYGIVAENGAYKGSAKDKATNQWVNFRWNPPRLPAFAIPESNLKVLPGEKPSEETKVPPRPATNGKANHTSGSAAKAEIKIEDVPASLRELFAELQISDAKGLDLLKRKNYDFAAVERILNDIRVEPAAAGA